MQDNPRLGIALMIATTVVFAVQDGISRYLAENYNVITVVTIRYMFFMCFVMAYSSRQKGGIRPVASSGQLPLQIGRGLLLVAQICVAILSFSTVGLVNFHAVFASYPLMVMALSVPILGEAVGWRRWLAVCVGFCGVLLILRPGTAMFSSASILPVSGLHDGGLWHFNPLCRTPRRRRDQLFLDGDGWRHCHALYRPLFLVAANWQRLGLDGFIMPNRHRRALSADQSA